MGNGKIRNILRHLPFCYALYTLLGVCFICVVSSANAKERKHVNFTFGRDGEIIYNLHTGTLNVYQDKKLLFKDIHASVVYKGDTLTSRAYTLRKLEVSEVSNNFGKGKRYTFISTHKDLPTLEQAFYIYPDKPYFFTEVILNGKDLESNYMSPWNGELTSLNDNTKVIIAPFDNDAFIRYHSKLLSKLSDSEVSSEFSAFYDPTKKDAIICGSVEHGIWKTGVQVNLKKQLKQHIRIWGGFTEYTVTRDEMEHGMVKGNHIKSPLIMLGYFKDWRSGLEAYGKANRTADPPLVEAWNGATPIGWNSWGAIQDKLDYDKVLKVVDFFADSLRSFRIGGTAYIDLDSYWDKLVSGNDHHLLKQFAVYCKSKGLQPGIYWAPFTDWGYKGGPKRKVEGSDYSYGDLWTKSAKGFHDFDGARALDPTHPGTLRRIDYFSSIFQDCGFKMIKIDFLGHAAAESSEFYDRDVTTGMQAYRTGMEYLVRKLKGMFIYAAISPSLATGRYAHSRRIACDAFASIKDTEYTLNSLTYGWWQTYLYDYIDADHVVLDHGSKEENCSRIVSSIITGTWITGDDFSVSGSWSRRAIKWYNDEGFLEIVKNGKAFRPVEDAEGTKSADMFTKRIGPYFYLAIFNQHGKQHTFRMPLTALGVRSSSVKVEDLVVHYSFTTSDSLHVELNANDARIYRISIL